MGSFHGEERGVFRQIAPALRRKDLNMASDHDGSKVAWFLVGAAVGAAVALLYAPGSGRETRKYIRKKADQGRDSLVEVSKDIRDRGREIYDRGREIAEEAGELLERGRKLVAR
jgi:hypothetical protein